MGGDRIALSFKRASRERQEHDVGGMILGRHNTSPRRARSPVIASRKRDLNGAERNLKGFRDLTMRLNCLGGRKNL
jgi:hypothetical protein